MGNTESTVIKLYPITKGTEDIYGSRKNNITQGNQTTTETNVNSTMTFYGSVGVIGDNFGSVNINEKVVKKARVIEVVVRVPDFFDKIKVEAVIEQTFAYVNGALEEIPDEVKSQIINETESLQQTVSKNESNKISSKEVVSWVHKLTSITGFGITLWGFIRGLFAS